METIEEVAEKFYSEQSESYENAIEPTFDNSRYLVTGFIDGAKWQAERMYSEEEVKKIAEEVRWQAIGDPIEFTKNFNKWFSQFKNQNNE
jgi:hypothetical protein